MLPALMFIIGERINPAGKPDLALAIREGRTNLIQQEAISQERCGAQALDINVYLPGIERAQTMRSVVEVVRSVSQLPLVIDDRDSDIVEVGLRQAETNVFINSPIDIDNTSTKIFSLAKQFNAEMFILPLKQNRIPANLTEHIHLSSLVLKRLEENGISRERVIIDAMLLALREAKAKVIETLDRIKRLKAEVGVRTVIGLGNISYGLKRRQALNARFLKLAKGSGLDFVICDPLQKEVMTAAMDESETFTQSDVKKFLEFAENLLGLIHE